MCFQEYPICLVRQSCMLDRYITYVYPFSRMMCTESIDRDVT